MDDAVAQAAVRTAAVALTERAGFVGVTTLDSDGSPETRVMFNLRRRRARAFASGPAALPRDLSTWLGTNTSSRKVNQVRADGRACLYYSDNKRYEGLCVKGRLEECLDADIRAALWTPRWEHYYRGGLDGGDFTVLRFVPESARYYHGLRAHDLDLRP